MADRNWKVTLKFWERMCIKLERRKTEEETKKKKYKMKPVREEEKKNNNNRTVNIVFNVAAVVSNDSLTSLISCDILLFMTYFVNLAVLTNTNMKVKSQ